MLYQGYVLQRCQKEKQASDVDLKKKKRQSKIQTRSALLGVMNDRVCTTVTILHSTKRVIFEQSLLGGKGASHVGI